MSWTDSNHDIFYCVDPSVVRTNTNVGSHSSHSTFTHMRRTSIGRLSPRGEESVDESTSFDLSCRDRSPGSMRVFRRFLCVTLLMLVSIQVCIGAKIIREWGLVEVNSISTVAELFNDLAIGRIESGDGFRLPEHYSDAPFSCSIAHTISGKFQSLPNNVKVQDAIEFGKFFKFVLDFTEPTSRAPKNALSLLMANASKPMWPEKYELSRKNNRQALHNAIIEWLQEKKLGWSKESLSSIGKPFVLQLGDILWQLDGHHDKLGAQQCAVPHVLSIFVGYNEPESYKRKRPNLKREHVHSMSQTLFSILQQVRLLQLCIIIIILCCITWTFVTLRYYV